MNSKINYLCLIDLCKEYTNDTNKTSIEVDQITLLTALMSNTNKMCFKNILIQ